MSSCFKKLNKIDDKTKLAVYGWFRQQEKSLKLRNIPSMITAICILYTHNDEVFEIINKNIKVSGNKKVISGSLGCGWNNHNYGAIIIPSSSQNVYQWNLRINKFLGNVVLSLGISSTITPNTGYQFHIDGYYQIHDGGHKYTAKGPWTTYCNKLKVNDKVTIHLDLTKSEIRFSINDNDQGIAYQNILKGEDIKYRLTVCIGEVGAEIEILDFKKL